MRIPDIEPPSGKVKAYAEWCACVLAFLGAFSIIVGVPFWISGRQSPVPILKHPEKTIDAADEEKLRPLTEEEFEEWQKAKRREPQGEF